MLCVNQANLIQSGLKAHLFGQAYATTSEKSNWKEQKLNWIEQKHTDTKICVARLLND